MSINLHRSGIAKIGLAALLIVMVAFSWLDPIDTQATEQVDTGLKRALITFAAARTLNGIVSVVQGTELSAQPLGVGVTLTVGQILDPVNDLIEKFSDLMLLASIAFGVQKFLLAVGASWIISLAFSVATLGWCYLYLTNKQRPSWLTRTVTVLVIARFAIPIALVGSGLVFDGFLKSTYDQSHAAIQAVSVDLAAAKDTLGSESALAIQNSAGETQKKPGFFSGLFGQKKDSVTPGEHDSTEAAATAPATTDKQSLWSKINPKKGIENLKQIVEKSTERIIDLMVVFVLQTILLPLLLIWIFASVLRGSYDIPSNLTRHFEPDTKTP